MHWRDYLSKFNFIIGPHKSKSTSRKCESFCINVVKVDFPDDILDNLDDGTNISIRTSLFDFSKNQFYGKQWRSSLNLVDDIDTTLDLGERIYFITSNLEESVSLVFEVVAILPDHKEKSLGWSVYSLFKSTVRVVDLNSQLAAELITLSVYKGTPRALTNLTNPIEKNPLLKAFDIFKVFIEVYTHPDFNICSALLPEDYLLNEDDELPGLRTASGDEDIFERPILAEFKSYLIENLNVLVEPNLLEFEEMLLKDINADRISNAKKPSAKDVGQFKIAERRLRVGVHNGYTFIDDSQIVYLNVVDPDIRRNSQSKFSSEKKNCMSAKNIVEVHLPTQDAFTIIFILEYVVSESVIDPNHKSVESKKKSEKKPIETHQCGTTASSQHIYQLRWTTYQPFNRDNLELTNSSVSTGLALQLDLIGGSIGAPENRMFYKPNVIVTDKSLEENKLRQEDDDDNDTDSINSKLVTSIQLNAIFKEKQKEVESEMKIVKQTSQKQLEQIPDQEQPKPRKPKLKPRHSYVPDKDILDKEVVPVKKEKSPEHLESVNHPFLSYSQPYPPMVYPYYPPMWPQVPIGKNENTADYGTLEPYVVQSTQDGQLEPSSYSMTKSLPPGIRPIQTRSHSGLGLTRAIYSRIFAAGFAEIVDSNGDHPFVVEPLSDDGPINFQMEQKDHRQTNEIIFQFMAFSLFGDLTRQKVSHKSVYFTFQFYRFPLVSTDRVSLEKVNNQLSDYEQCSTYILRRINKTNDTEDETPGIMLKFILDPGYMSPGEMFSFLEYLSLQILHIDVWDGESLMLIGSCGVKLKHLLRQGKTSVQVAYELDIINDLEIDNEGVSDLKGRLHLRMANLGAASTNVSRITVIPHPKKGALIDATRFDSPCANIVAMNKGIVNDDLADSASFVNRMNVSGLIIRPQPAEVRNRELSQLLNRSANQTNGDNEMTHGPDKNRDQKLERYKNILQTLDNPSDPSENSRLILQSQRNETLEKYRKLRTIEIYRDHEKPEVIKKMLNGVIQKDITLYPKFGTTELFEVQIRNHFNEDQNIQIEINEESNTLVPVTNPLELRALKALYSVTTITEDGLITYDKRSSHYMLFMRAKETIIVPFKYTNLYCQNTYQTLEPQSPMMTASMKQTNKIDNIDLESIINFRAKSSGKLITAVRVTVVPQPPTVDQIFRFYHPEQSFLKRLIRLPPLQIMGGGSNDTIRTMTRCSDAEVLAECKHVPVGTPHDVFVKVPCGPAPQIREFLLAVYVDKFLLRPVQVWGFNVHSQSRVDIMAHQGQTTNFTLIVKGSTSTHQVKVFSSHPDELDVGSVQENNFTLAAHCVYELKLGLTPLRTGNRSFQINIVDVDSHHLVRSWTICAICKDPDVTKMFEIELPINYGTNSTANRKKISFQNSYGFKKRFYIHTDRPELVAFKETTLSIEANESENIGIIFYPVKKPTKDKIYVFINDDEGKNEETLALIVNYI